MDSGNLNDQAGVLLLLELPRQSGPEQRERPEAFDAPQARFDVEERGGQPALLLIGGAPTVHLRDPLL